ncbi:hypothetical protein F5884DRAFT_781464 [Xylogone sp. PMI_703]|nr:hypothetical protein F5884DRAFT_781464 [Xylogone sp. PMI_703]
MTDGRLVESWTWYAVASLSLVLRCISQAIRLGGLRYYRLDDYLMLVTFAFYTNVIVCVNIQEKHPFTNILPPAGTSGMTPSEIADRIYGSKITFSIEESMLMTQWGCKICMCLLYHKLTAGLRQQLLVKFLIGYIILGWLITEIFFFGVWCRPFLNYFRVMDDNNLQCETSGKHLIMSYVFNLSSDLLMLCVPIPTLLKSQLELKQKVTLTGIFSLGIFAIISATLNRYYCFAHPNSILWIFWYVREASTAVIVTNIPLCYALLQKLLVSKLLDSFLGARLTSRLSPRSKADPLSTKSNQGHPSKQGIRLNDDGSESTKDLTSQDPIALHNWQHNEHSDSNDSITRIQSSNKWTRDIIQGKIGTISTVTASREPAEDHKKSGAGRSRVG